MSDDFVVEHNKSHYDSITDAWKYILGEHLHWGYFRDPQEGLLTATNNLVDMLAAMGPITAGMKVLDVGCGTGGPALYLHEKHGCEVLGISTSERGIQLAIENSSRRGAGRSVTFRVADAMDNGLADGSFDLVWVMESSHLMRDKPRLLSECHRVLRKGSTLLLCDLILKTNLTLKDLVAHRAELLVLEGVFGKAKMETLEFYRNELVRAGFADVRVVDVSRNVTPTIACWRRNLQEHENEILRYLSREQIDQFQAAIDILSRFFTSAVLGYGLVSASKS